MAPESTQINVRSRTDQDIDNCITILRRVYAKDAYPVEGVSNPLPFLQYPDLIFALVATTPSNTITGHIAIGQPRDASLAGKLFRQTHPDTNIATLERLFVDPDARGRGVGERLVNEAVERGKGDGLRLVLLVLVKDQGALRLYRRLGWREFGRGVYRFGEREVEGICLASPVEGGE